MTTDNVPMQEPNEQPLAAEEVVKPKRTRRTKVAASRSTWRAFTCLRIASMEAAAMWWHSSTIN